MLHSWATVYYAEVFFLALFNVVHDCAAAVVPIGYRCATG
jgi:hypothetical protein